MPVSLASSQAIHRALKASGVRVVSALPETWLLHLIRLADEDPETTLVRLAKEEEGVGVAAGVHLAGGRSALLMQNHGLFQAVNAIVGLSLLYRIPLLMLVSDRGHLGERDTWQTEGGRYTRRILDALNIVHHDLVDDREVAQVVAQAMTLAQSSLAPVALLLTRRLMLEEAAK